MKSNFGTVGSDANVYNDDEKDIESRNPDCFQSTRWYNDKKVKFVDINAYLGNGEFVSDNEENITAMNMSAVNWFEDPSKSVVNWLKDPYEYSMNDEIKGHMDGGKKCTVTNKIELLHDVRFYQKKFQPNVKMQGATSKAAIVPVAEGFLKIPTIREGIFMKISKIKLHQMHFAIDDQGAMTSNLSFRSSYTKSMAKNDKILCDVQKYVNNDCSSSVNLQNLSLHFCESGGEIAEQFENSFINMEHANKKVR